MFETPRNWITNCLKRIHIGCLNSEWSGEIYLLSLRVVSFLCGGFYGQNIERGYINILFNNVIVMHYNSSFEINKLISYGIN